MQPQTYHQFLQKYYKFAKSQLAFDVEIEIEARFKAPSDVWEHILDFYKKESNLKFCTVNITDYFYGSCRATVSAEGHNILNIQKHVVATLACPERNCKFVVSSETRLGDKFSTPDALPSHTRSKQRTTFFDHGINIDFTKIMHEVCEYEIELEIKIRVEDAYWLHRFEHALQKICHLWREHMSQATVQNEMKQFSKHGARFCGTVPKTLHRKDLLKVQTYAVSLKYDGIRYLMYICAKDRQCFLFSRNMKMIDKKLVFMNFPGFIADVVLDVEYMPFDDIFVVLDILKYGGVDFRVKGLTLAQRLELIHQFELPSATFMVKQYCTKREDKKKIICGYDRQSYATDGLVLTPCTAPYPEVIYKWKPKSLQTIDFRVRGNTLEELYVIGHTGNEELFAIATTVTICCDASAGSIVECAFTQWTERERNVTFKRVRGDKDRPNFIVVAQEALQAYHEDVQLSELLDALS